jgi:3-isopropylmalate/(R)-2-methylmalate dehydratase large subunit
MGKTLFDKIWDNHIVKDIQDGPSVLYIDRQYIHEVTSPQAFEGLEKRGLKVFRPEKTFATPDHNVPTENQHLEIREELSRNQVKKLEENCEKHNIEIFNLGSDKHGVVHIVGPELALTQPGMTIVCGDSHTATHGAFGSIAFGIGTSEIEMVLASQCLMQVKPKTMRITINGELKENVTAKDVILYIVNKMTTGGGTGYFIEYAGDVFENMSMEERMTICNMSIELGARGGLIAVDETTINYIQNREFAPKGSDWNDALEDWMNLHSDADAKFDKEVEFKAEDIDIMITYGTTPGMGMSINAHIPKLDEVAEQARPTFEKSLNYMGLNAGEKLKGKPIDYVFIGSCTNGRIEDFRAAAEVAKGNKVSSKVTVWLVPGSKMVEQQILEEGLDQIFFEAGMRLRQPGCSACLAMNEDKIPAGKYSVSTSNRNFEGRQGPNSRTFLASPETAMASAILGRVADVTEV